MLCLRFDDFAFFGGDAVEVVDEVVDLGVGGNYAFGIHSRLGCNVLEYCVGH